MPVVVFEGPDEGGKTTLLRATVEVLDSMGRSFTVVKSPAGSEQGWDSAWDSWSDIQGLDGRVNDVVNHVFLLDRTPEISEFVYGILRGKTRLFQPLESLHRFRLGQKMLVNCLPPLGQYAVEVADKPQAEHTDPFGHRLEDKLLSAALLYQVVDSLYSRTEHKDFRYFRWNRFDTVNMWAHYLVSLGGYLRMTPLDLKETFYTKVDTFFPTK